MLARFFDPAGEVVKERVRSAAPGGERDLRDLIMPSERRALDLAKAYRVLVKRQRWDLGRDVVLDGPLPVHEKIENGDTKLSETGRVFRDGRLWSIGPRIAGLTPARVDGARSPARAILLPPASAVRAPSSPLVSSASNRRRGEPAWNVA